MQFQQCFTTTTTAKSNKTSSRKLKKKMSLGWTLYFIKVNKKKNMNIKLFIFKEVFKYVNKQRML